MIGRHLYKYREYEPEVTRALLQHVRFQPGDVMLDVGANFGLLMENLRLNASTMIMAVPMAVGAKPGIEQLHRYGAGNSGRHSLLPLHKGESLAVRTTTLDACSSDASGCLPNTRRATCAVAAWSQAIS